ncbi:MAG: dienelactone hydrolase family protein [Alphaproteobacteria bacterium]|nr:dienelactone hydrolase family protein [Alphaproteobacteria bacterium]
MILRFILLAMLVFAAQPVLADDSVALDWGGQHRPFIVHLPQDAPKENLPVVLVLHGGGGNAENMRTMTGMNDVADRHGFIAVYPEGYGSPLMDRIRTWNAGVCCGPALKKESDDVGYIGAVIDALIAQYKIDASRVYATGHSNGAMMSYRLACEMSGRIAAIAPNAGQREVAQCKLERPVPVLHMHGTKDPCALYDGGEKCGGCVSKFLHFNVEKDRSCLPARTVAQDAAKLNGCTLETEITMQKGAVTCEKYKCARDAAVEFCSIAGMGHRWAGASDKGPTACASQPDKKICSRYAEIVGPGNQDVDAGEMAWAFFSRFSLPK